MGVGQQACIASQLGETHRLHQERQCVGTIAQPRDDRAQHLDRQGVAAAVQLVYERFRVFQPLLRVVEIVPCQRRVCLRDCSCKPILRLEQPELLTLEDLGEPIQGLHQLAHGLGAGTQGVDANLFGEAAQGQSRQLPALWPRRRGFPAHSRRGARRPE